MLSILVMGGIVCRMLGSHALQLLLLQSDGNESHSRSTNCKFGRWKPIRRYSSRFSGLDVQRKHRHVILVQIEFVGAQDCRNSCFQGATVLQWELVLFIKVVWLRCFE